MGFPLGSWMIDAFVAIQWLPLTLSIRVPGVGVWEPVADDGVWKVRGSSSPGAVGNVILRRCVNVCMSSLLRRRDVLSRAWVFDMYCRSTLGCGVRDCIGVGEFGRFRCVCVGRARESGDVRGVLGGSRGGDAKFWLEVDMMAFHFWVMWRRDCFVGRVKLGLLVASTSAQGLLVIVYPWSCRISS